MDLVQVGLYLTSVWSGGTAVKLAKSSPIVGEIIVGALLGPPLANFVPQPSGLELAGFLGVQLAVLEAGLMTDWTTLKEIALRAFIVAVVGIIFPFGVGLCLVTLAWKYSFLQGFAVGAAIAPTSLGVTSRLLSDRGELFSKLGKLISTAALFDDVLSLILLSEVLVLARDTKSTWDILAPIVFSIVFVVATVALSMAVPYVLPVALKLLPPAIADGTELMLLLLLVILLTYIAELASTSFLLGGFLAGVSFSSREKTVTNFNNQSKRIVRWLFRLFFAATIAFSIPLRTLFRVDSLGLGACLAVVAIVGKLFSGLCAQDIREDGLALGVAMLGRGEFGFLIAAEAFSSGLIPEILYASTVWGIFVPTLVAPIFFPIAFNLRSKYQQKKRERNPSTAASSSSNNPDAVQEENQPSEEELVKTEL